LIDDCSDRCQSNKHPPPHLAVEVSFALDAAIILPAIIFQFDPNPFPGRKLSLAYEADGSCPTIVEFDRLAYRKLRHDQGDDSME
jgi:hypothetical protein